MIEVKLIPCPFCGKGLRINSSGGYEHDSEGCILHGFEICNEKQLNQWNTRKPMEDIVERLEERTEYFRDCSKYDNETDEQEEKSFNQIFIYEVADLVDDMIDIVKEGMTDE